MKFIIDREKWLRGEGSDGSCLLRSTDGKMCFIGQICNQLGIEDKFLQDVDSIYGFLSSNDHLTDRGYLINIVRDFIIDGSANEKSFVCDAYFYNDTEDTSDEERENVITALFEGEGYELEFVN